MIFRKCLASVLSCLLGVLCSLSPIAANAQTTGQWTTLTNAPIIPIHNALLPTGKVLMWGRAGARTVWDPGTNQAAGSSADPEYDQFCSAHVFLADGRMFDAGGHIVDFVGLAKASTYDAATNTWAGAPDMNAGRWYPTATALPNGDALVVSGQIDTTTGVNTLPQVYQAAANTWRDLSAARLNLELYPMMFVAPNGKVINVGPGTTTRYLDTVGSGAWSFVGNHIFSSSRSYGSAVMYAPGKILVVGGGDPPTATAEVIDLNASAPAWRAVPSMSIARRHLNTTLLPDGTVLVTGGSSGSGFDNRTTPVFTAELWDPATERWTTLSSASVGRFYHSSAVLLPDGRVLSTGGEGKTDVEVFSPPYLFKGGTRPTISGMPASVGYAQKFTVQSPDATSIGKVTLIRLPSVTHAFNQNQRLNVLQFAQGAATGTIDITTPADANLAPPGDYLLFAVNSTGVPSVGTLVRLSASAPTPPPDPPSLTSLSPSSTTAGGPAFTLTLNGSNFVSGVSVLWNGAARTTTFGSVNQATAAIPASDISAAGTAQVSALNPGSTTASNTLSFTVTAAVAATPTLSSLSPSNATAGGPAFTLTVNGSNFVSGASVLWNGAARTTSFVSTTQLKASIPAGDIAAAGTAQVSVLNSGTTTASNALPFTIATAVATNTLKVTKSGTAPTRGTVTSNPAGISCGSRCSAAFTTDKTVTLTATTSGNGVFAGWSGEGCNGTGVCTVTMSASRSVTATFNSGKAR